MSITRCNSFMPSGVFDQGINFSWRRLSSFHRSWTSLRVATPYYTTDSISVQYLIAKVIVIMRSDCNLGKCTFDWRNSMWEFVDNIYSVAIADTTRMKNRVFIVKRGLLLQVFGDCCSGYKLGDPIDQQFQPILYEFEWNCSVKYLLIV